MADVIEFLKLLLFLKVVLVTPQPIAIGAEWITMTPHDELSAINVGASIQIDVTQYVDPFDWEAAKKLFPDNTVEGKLEFENGASAHIASRGTAHSNEFVHLLVASNGPIPLDAPVAKVLLRSQQPLTGVNVYWKNGSK